MSGDEDQFLTFAARLKLCILRTKARQFIREVKRLALVGLRQRKELTKSRTFAFVSL